MDLIFWSDFLIKTFWAQNFYNIFLPVYSYILYSLNNIHLLVCVCLHDVFPCKNKSLQSLDFELVFNLIQSQKMNFLKCWLWPASVVKEKRRESIHINPKFLLFFYKIKCCFYVVIVLGIKIIHMVLSNI